MTLPSAKTSDNLTTWLKQFNLSISIFGIQEKKIIDTLFFWGATETFPSTH